MASGTATPNYRGQLTANAVDTVTMDRAWPSLTIMTDASARVDFTVDGSTPAAHSRPLAGPDDYTGGYILAGSYETTVAVDPKSPATVKLVSTGSPQYSVVAEPAAGVPPLSGQSVPWGNQAGPPVSAPASGASNVFVDSNGAIWAWSGSAWYAAGSGVELAEAELNTSQAVGSITTTLADVTGLSITFVAPARAFRLELTDCEFVMSASPNYCNALITDSANTVIAQGPTLSTPSAATIQWLPFLGARLPRTGASGGSYSITPGQSYTFKVRADTNAGTALLWTNSGVTRPTLRAVTC